jgi:septal ring factor EnvC (AmiA/AmiB activator)
MLAMDIFGDLVGCATAIFTALAAWAAWRATSVAKSAAEESGKISNQQTTALTVAAKANALASRINFYDRQIAEIESAIREGQMSPNRLANLEKTLEQLKAEQRHLAFWLDRQLDSLGVGLGNLDNGSGYKPPNKQ